MTCPQLACEQILKTPSSQSPDAKVPPDPRLPSSGDQPGQNECERQLAEAQRLAGVGSWHWEANKLVWSQELFHLLGLSPQKDQPSVDLFLSRIHPADRPLVTDLLARPDLNKLRDKVEVRLHPVKGVVRTVELRVGVVKGTDSQPSRLVGTALDITERCEVEKELRISRDRLESTISRRSKELVQANERLVSELADRHSVEEALRRSEDRFRKIFEEAPIGMVVGGKDFRILRVNNAFCRMTGYTEKDLLGRTLADLTHPEDLQEDVSWTAGFFRDEKPSFQMEKRFCTRQGKVLWIRMTVSVVRDDAGRISYAIAMVENITERKKSAEKILFQASILNQVLNGVVGSDLSGRITYWNRHAESLYQWKAEDVMGRRIFDVLTPRLPRKEQDRLLANLKEQGSWEGEITQKRKDGTTFPAYVIDVLVKDAQGRPVGFVSVSLDITERRLSEEQLRKSREELRALTGHLQWVREKERSNISREIHDELGQALTGLKMDLSWLETRLSKGLVSLLRTPIFQKLNSMADIIDNTVRQVRRITTELRPRVLDELGLVAAIEWQSHEFQNRTGIHCRFICGQENIELRQEEATTVFRILQETLTNVTRHSGATSVEIRLVDAEDSLQLEVRDNGRGISPAKLAGTHSMGLVGMRERALLSRGRLDIKGVKGEGTTVTLIMPTSRKTKKKSFPKRGSRKS